MEPSSVIIWQDIEKLDTRLQKAQAKRFWATYIFLCIMPPKYIKNGLGQWTVKTVDNTYYHSQCRYDEIVASHSTCCEHFHPNFIYYHRNLLNKWTFALNQADIILKSDESMKKVLQWMNKNIQRKKNDGRREKGEQNFSGLLEAARKQYIEILNELDAARKQRNMDQNQTRWVSPFYWNVLDFQNEMKLPTMLREHTFEGKQMEMHKLFRAYKKCNFGEMNFGDTWGLDNITKWTNNDRRFDFRKSYLQLRFEKILKENNGVTHLTNLTDKQINQTLFGKGQNKFSFDWKTQDKVIATIKDQQQKSDRPFYRYYKNIYTIPFKDFSKKFLYEYRYQSSVETPHNYMDNNLGYIFENNMYAVYNPLFCMYHGYIDLMAEQYFRRIKYQDTPQYKGDDKKGEAVKGLLSFLQITFKRRKSSQQNQWKPDLMNRIYTEKVALSYCDQFKIKQYSYKNYPVIEWINLDGYQQGQRKNIRQDYFAFGKYGDLMIKQDQIGKRLRYSYEQQDFYRQYLEMKQVENIPPQLEKYPFNFDYDVLIKNDRDLPDGYRLLNIEADRLLQYTKFIEIQSRNTQQRPFLMQVRSAKISNKTQDLKTIETKKTLIQKQLPNLEETVKSSNPILFLQKNEIIQRAEAFKEKIRKYSLLYARIQYLTTVASCNVDLKIKMKDGINFEWVNSGNLLISSSRSKIENEKQLTLRTFPILTRGAQAVSCPNCMQYNTFTFNLFQNFEGYLTPFFIDLHLNAEFGILYDSRKTKETEKHFGDILELKHDFPLSENKNQFKLTFPKGADEVTFRLIKCNFLDGTDKEEQDPFYSYKVTLQAESIDLMTDQPFVSLVAHKESLNTEISFERLRAHPNPKHPKATKQLVYQNFNGTLLVFKGNHLSETRHFQFSMMNYWRKASYDIRVNDQYEIIVRDSDYYTKRKIFQ